MRDPDEVSLQLDHNEERDLFGLCSDNLVEDLSTVLLVLLLLSIFSVSHV
jgi:hypothetical protein